MKGWVVVRTHSCREKWAAENISRQGARPYIPKIAERIKLRAHRHEMITRVRPLFLSYVFVEVNGAWRFLLGTFGVAGVIMQGAFPALLKDKDIEALRQLEDEDGLIVLPKRPVERRFRPGTPVRISDGVYSGYKGIYDGVGPQERERVLLDYLGRKTSVLIGANLLEAA